MSSKAHVITGTTGRDSTVAVARPKRSVARASGEHDYQLLPAAQREGDQRPTVGLLDSLVDAAVTNLAVLTRDYSFLVG